MSLISAHGLSKSYADRQVLEDASITVEAGDRLGLIGINGAGKSTLIRILIGTETADAGEIQRKRGLTVACIEQTPKLDPEQTVQEHIQTGLAGNLNIRRELDAIHHALDQSPDEATMSNLIEDQARLTEALERAGGWNVEHRMEAAMLALSVPPGDRKIGTLSQGEARRVALCTGLLEAPDLLILDEPTNHIDVAAIEWLEETLVDYPGGLILVTHDRYFLDRVANRHAEIDRGQLRLYEGNYSEYLAARAEREAMEATVEHKRQRAIENELHWVRRRAPARTTKQKARLERFDALVAARPKTIAREPSFQLAHPPRTGKSILELANVSKGYGERTLIRDLDLLLKKGDRLGIIGPNGIGKTTLLRMIIGEIPPDQGEVILGQNTLFSYADQTRPLDLDNTVLSEVAGESDFVQVGEDSISVHSFLSGLLFDGATQRTKIAALSGGERSRVALAKALRITANLLILDEPTNDLDLPTLRVLEDALLEYPGCALIVSHDRYFLDRVATGYLVFEGDSRIVRYESLPKKLATLEAEPPPSPSPASKPSTPTASSGPKKKRTFKEERELEGMEAKILEAESLVESLEATLSDPEALRKLGAGAKTKVDALERARAEVDVLYARWAELGAIGG